MHAMSSVWKSENSLLVLVLLCHMSSRDRTWALKVGSMSANLLTHLSGHLSDSLEIISSAVHEKGKPAGRGSVNYCRMKRW